MYGYEEHIEISPEQVLQKVSQQEIIEWVLGLPLDFKRKYCSPYREDKKPNCRFDVREDGAILFIDFGERNFRPDKTHRTCFGMVIDRYEVDLTNALRLICEHFGLSRSPQDYSEVVPKVYVKSKKEVSKDCVITYEKRAYEKRDKLFWSQFLIKPEHLEEDEVYATSKFYLQYPDSPKKHINVYGLCYAIDFLTKVKLYQPYSKDYKWISNCDEDTIGNVNNLPATGNELVISKSYKDHRVLRNLGLTENIIWLQNEGCTPSTFILENLLSRFKLITIFYDNDQSGIIAGHRLADTLNNIRLASTRTIHIPKKYAQKDPAELVAKEGRHDTIKILKKMGL